MKSKTPDYRGWMHGLLVCALLLSATLPAWAQGDAGPRLGVSLGDVFGVAGGQVTVPVMLISHDPEARIGSVEATVSLESKVVSFARAEKVFSLDRVGGVIEAHETKDSANPNISRVRFRVVTQGDPRKSLPDGLILALIFDVKATASAGALVPLKLDKISITDFTTPPKEIPGAVGKNGSIVVTLPEEVPVMPCFFFSH